jgi:hypothetical protein
MITINYAFVLFHKSQTVQYESTGVNRRAFEKKKKKEEKGKYIDICLYRDGAVLF